MLSRKAETMIAGFKAYLLECGKFDESYAFEKAAKYFDKIERELRSPAQEFSMDVLFR